MWIFSSFDMLIQINVQHQNKWYPSQTKDKLPTAVDSCPGANTPYLKLELALFHYNIRQLYELQHLANQIKKSSFFW